MHLRNSPSRWRYFKLRHYLNQWERGTQPFTDGKYLLPLAKVLNVNPRWLLYHEGEPNPLQELNADELDLLLAFRALQTDAARNAVITLTKNMASG